MRVRIQVWERESSGAFTPTTMTPATVPLSLRLCLATLNPLLVHPRPTLNLGVEIHQRPQR